MQGRAIIAVAVLLIGAGIGLAVARDDGEGKEPQPNGQPARIITVAGTATVSTAPDEASIELSIRSEAPTAEEAFQLGSERLDSLMKELKAAGIEDKDIETTNVQLDRRTRDRGTPREETFYTSETRLSVTVHDLTKVGEIATRAVSAGANVVGGIEFTLADQNDARQQALEEAVEGARAKAETMATTAGERLGEVVQIDETNSEYEPYYTSNLKVEASYGTALSRSYDYSVSPGDVETRVTVTVVFALGDSSGSEGED